MALTAGTLSQISVGANVASLSSTAASGGTGPYTQQWHRSATNAFTPGPGTAIPGATALALQDTGLPPNSVRYYKVVYTDTGASNATITSTQLAVTTAAATNPALNQFRMKPILGMPRLLTQTNTVSCMVDTSQSGSLIAGQAVKVVDSAGGIPKVVACAANTDSCFGFINYDAKNSVFVAGNAVEISRKGNYLYLLAATAIARGAAVQLNVATPGSVAAAVTSGANVVGEAFDKAAAGDLFGVFISATSFQYVP